MGKSVIRCALYIFNLSGFIKTPFVTHVNKLLINLAKIRQRFIYVEGLKFFKKVGLISCDKKRLTVLIPEVFVV